MIIVTYIVTIILFCIAAWVVRIFLMPIVWIYKTIAKEPFIPPLHPVYLMPFVCGTIILLYLTRYIWNKMGFEMGWIFPTIILILHFVAGSLPGANKPNQAQAFGVVFAVALCGLFSLLF